MVAGNITSKYDKQNGRVIAISSLALISPFRILLNHVKEIFPEAYFVFACLNQSMGTKVPPLVVSTLNFEKIYYIKKNIKI